MSPDGGAFKAKEPNKDWAHKLRARYLAGERLMMAQVSLASDALGEVWTDEDGQRACRPKLELESAA